MKNWIPCHYLHRHIFYHTYISLLPSRCWSIPLKKRFVVRSTRIFSFTLHIQNVTVLHMCVVYFVWYKLDNFPQRKMYWFSLIWARAPWWLWECAERVAMLELQHHIAKLWINSHRLNSLCRYSASTLLSGTEYCSVLRRMSGAGCWCL